MMHIYDDRSLTGKPKTSGKKKSLKAMAIAANRNHIAKLNNFKTNAYKRGMGSSFYGTQEWRKLRYKVLVKSNGCCVLCGRSSRKNHIVLHVDHIKPRYTHPWLELEESNLQVLCEDCNLGKGIS